jgi:Flp pilus assembly pilin Flp
MTMFRKLARQDRGAAAMEFALAAPVLFTMVVGLSQLGIMYSANTGVHHAVEEAARLAAVFPTPTDDQIKQKIQSTKFMVQGVVTPKVERGVTSAGEPYIDISLGYKVPLDLVFVSVDSVNVQHSRRVFRQLTPAEIAQLNGAGGSGGFDDTGDEPSDPLGDTPIEPEPEPVPEPSPPPTSPPPTTTPTPTPTPKPNPAPDDKGGKLPPGNGKGKGKGK